MPAILKPVIGLLVLFACAASIAQSRDYEVEIIVFERNDTDNLSGESWDLTPVQLADHRSHLLELSAKTQEMAFEPGLVHLHNVARNLDNSGFSLIRTARWIQPPSYFQHAPVVSLGDESSTLPHAFIRIYKTSLIFADLYLQLLPEAPHVLPVEPGLEPQPDFTQPIENFADATELITEVQPESEPPLQPYYLLSEKRRLKFNEIHYFDHPRFGMILGIWPINLDDT